jgi:hypothetical protein
VALPLIEVGRPLQVIFVVLISEQYPSNPIGYNDPLEPVPRRAGAS